MHPTQFLQAQKIQPRSFGTVMAAPFHSCLLCMLLLVVACSSETSPETIRQDSLPKAATLDKVPAPVIPKPFELPEPNIVKIREQALRGDGQLYVYLYQNFDSLQPKKIIRQEGEHECEFSQAFEYGIVYYERHCSVDWISYRLRLPYFPLARLKHVLAVIFDSDLRVWSHDSLTYEYNLPHAYGTGSFHYRKVGGWWIVNMWFSD
jgi:hypothetical protein